LKKTLLFLLLTISNNLICNTQEEFSNTQKISFIEAFLNCSFSINQQDNIVYKHYANENESFCHSIAQLYKLFKEIRDHAEFVEMGLVLTELEEKLRQHQIKNPEDISELNKLEWQLERFNDFLYGDDLKRLPSEQQRQIKEHRHKLANVCEHGTAQDIKNAKQQTLHRQDQISLEQFLGALFQ
jgi:hypothetical protein